jgi:hypothetical protein
MRSALPHEIQWFDLLPMELPNNKLYILKLSTEQIAYHQSGKQPECSFTDFTFEH